MLEDLLPGTLLQKCYIFQSSHQSSIFIHIGNHITDYSMASSTEKRFKSNDDVGNFFKSFTSAQWLQICNPVDEKDNNTVYQCPNKNCITKKNPVNRTHLQIKRVNIQI